MIALALKALGLMRVSEHGSEKVGQARTAETLEQHIMDVNIAKSDAEWWAHGEIMMLRAEVKAERDERISAVNNMAADWQAERERAATDLAAQAEEIDRLNRELDGKIGVIDSLYARIDALIPDAQKWRDYLKRSRDRKAGRKS